MKQEYQIDDKVRFKKKHPCGNDIWKIIKIGMDFKAECIGCGKIITMPRKKFIKSVKEKVEEN